jgi:hypothetical protein
MPFAHYPAVLAQALHEMVDLLRLLGEVEEADALEREALTTTSLRTAIIAARRRLEFTRDDFPSFMAGAALGWLRMGVTAVADAHLHAAEEMAQKARQLTRAGVTHITRAS